MTFLALVIRHAARRVSSARRVDAGPNRMEDAAGSAAMHKK
ncbi:hypothetical protein [Sorangium sp. So ce1099]